MSDPDFLDSNVLIYAHITSDPRKQGIAQELVRKAILGRFVISTQVLAEFASTFLHKISPPARPDELKPMLDAFSPIRVIVPDPEMLRRAVEVRAEYGLHFYDSMILAAAERGGCSRVWSEDLNPGQRYFGIAVENPFA